MWQPGGAGKPDPALLDRWFDAETTDVIVRDRVCHSFCAMPDPVLS